MKKRKFMWFFAPDDGGGAGGGTALESLPGPEPEVETTLEMEGATAEPEPKADVFDPKAFAETFGKTVGESLKGAVPKAPEKPLTPQEAAKLLNVWEPDEAWYTKYDNLETRKAAVAEQRDALIRQADTITQIRLNQQREQYEAQLAPMKEFMQQQEVAARQGRFETAFPDLKGPTFSDMISYAAHTLAKEGKTFPTEKEAFAAVAQRVVALKQSSDPSFKLSSGATPPPKKATGAIPVTSPGAGGGSGGPTKEPAGKSRALSILGPVGGD